MALRLRPSMLNDLGLVPALKWQGREVSKRTGLRVRVLAESISDDLSEQHKTCIYRIVQESLHNCAQHAEAATAWVTVKQEAGRIRLSIQDDGKGFPSSSAERERGMGLLGMQERAAHLGGTFSIFCILVSRRIRSPNGPRSNCARPSRVIPRPAICCGIGMGSSGRTSCSRCRPWASNKVFIQFDIYDRDRRSADIHQTILTAFGLSDLMEQRVRQRTADASPARRNAQARHEDRSRLLQVRSRHSKGARFARRMRFREMNSYNPRG